jgi:hypothetical protein
MLFRKISILIVEHKALSQKIDFFSVSAVNTLNPMWPPLKKSRHRELCYWQHVSFPSIWNMEHEVWWKTVGSSFQMTGSSCLQIWIDRPSFPQSLDTGSDTKLLKHFYTERLTSHVPQQPLVTFIKFDNVSVRVRRRQCDLLWSRTSFYMLSASNAERCLSLVLLLVNGVSFQQKLSEKVFTLQWIPARCFTNFSTLLPSRFDVYRETWHSQMHPQRWDTWYEYFVR